MKSLSLNYLKLLTAFILFCAFSNAKANNKSEVKRPASAHVYFSNEIPVAGRATEGKEFTINEKGGFAYLIVNNYPDNFSYDELHVKILKEFGGTSETFDNKVYTISTALYYTYIKYSFFTAGNYTFEVSNKYGSYLGSASVTIKIESASTSTSGGDDCVAGSYKKYFNSSMGFSMCIPKDSYAEDVSEGKITLKEFFGKKLDISFLKESQLPDGIDKYDATVTEMTRDLVRSSFPSYYRKEFKLLSSDNGNTIYRSVTSATSTSGTEYQQSVFYIHMNGNKIRGNDFMTISGPLATPSEDGLYQIIIEKGMLRNFKVY